MLIAALCVIIFASGCITPSVPADTADPLDLTASFEAGDRYNTGNYTVIVLEGTYREMGRQYGALMKDELLDEYNIVTESIQARGFTLEEIRGVASDGTGKQSERMKEIFCGMAETSGLTKYDISVLYYGPALYISMFRGCSYLAVWDTYTTDGSVIASRNWDLPDPLNWMNPYYVLVVYDPTDGSNGVATFGPAGVRPETLMNSKGLFIADDNAALSGQEAGRPDLITEFLRLMLDYSDLTSMDAALQGISPNIPWIVDVAGPQGAYVYEVNLEKTIRRTGDGVVAAANHFVDPFWDVTPAEHSLTRYNNLISQADMAKGTIDARMLMTIRDVLVADGGATFRHSLLVKDDDTKYSSNHQVVFVPETRTLWIKVVDHEWQKVELASLFAK